MQAKSFIDILANELRKEIRAEVEAEVAARSFGGAAAAARIETSHKAESVELWLNLKMGGALTGVGSGSRPLSQSVNRYQASGNSAKKQSAPVLQLVSPKKADSPTERSGTAKTIEQTFALEFFKREGSSLAATFTETQLKSEFRKIALCIHPDRHTGASAEQTKSYSARFQTLVESAESLEAALR